MLYILLRPQKNPNPRRLHYTRMEKQRLRRMRTLVVILDISGESMAPWSAAFTIIVLRCSVLTPAPLNRSSSPRTLHDDDDRKPHSALDVTTENPAAGAAGELEERNAVARKKPRQALACRPASGVRHDSAAAIAMGRCVGYGVSLAMASELQTLVGCSSLWKWCFDCQFAV